MNHEINPIQADNPYPFLQSPLCGAKTRQGTPCRAPAVNSKKRCRMHGGKGSGAPVGSQNALSHGFNTQEAKRLKKTIRLLLKKSKF